MHDTEWLKEILKETESQHPGTEAYNLQQVVKAFEDAMPNYQGIQGQDLISWSEDENPTIEMSRLRNGLTTMAKELTEEQRIEITNSVQMEVMREVNAEFGVKPKF